MMHVACPRRALVVQIPQIEIPLKHRLDVLLFANGETPIGMHLKCFVGLGYSIVLKSSSHIYLWVGTEVPTQKPLDNCFVHVRE